MCSPEVQSDFPCSKTGGHRLAGLLFGKNSNLQANLERNCLAFIQYRNFPDGQSFIRVQGQRQSVMETLTQLQSMEDTIEAGCFSTPPLYPPKVRGLSEGNLKPRDPQSAPVVEGSSSELLQAIAKLSTDVQQAMRIHSYQDRPVAEPPLVSRASTRPSMKRKIEYYVALDFPQDLVEATLESLGLDASDNDILNRLNRLVKGKHASLNMVNTPTVCPPPPPPPSYGEPLTSHVTQPRRVMDPSKLRPIVIDGSNVAMR